MRWVRCIAASMVLVAALGSSTRCTLAKADQLGAEQTLDLDGSDRAPDPRGHEPARFLLFATTDLWRHGGFAHGGVLWSPFGLDREGPVLKLMFGSGIYHYISGALGNIDVRGEQLTAGILPGWRFIRNGFIVTVFAGYDFQSHRLFPDDPTAGLRGHYSGLRAGFELWHEPSTTTMFAADASISTIGWGYSARIAAGWRLFDLFYLGPDISAFATGDNYQQFRAGLHITGLRTGRFEWSAGLGFAGDSDHRAGAYGKLGLITRR